jgi:hypothetical protein
VIVSRTDSRKRYVKVLPFKDGYDKKVAIGSVPRGSTYQATLPPALRKRL